MTITKREQEEQDEDKGVSTSSMSHNKIKKQFNNNKSNKLIILVFRHASPS